MTMLFAISSSLWRRLRTATADSVEVARLLSGHSSACASVVVAIFTVGTLWLGAWYIADQDAVRTQSAAYNETANLTRAFEENIIRLIQAYDQVLLFARSSYATAPHDFNLVKWAKEQHFATDAAVQIGIINRSGVLVASNLGAPNTIIDLSDREHFRVHLNDTRDFLYISAPVRGRLSQKWSVQLSRRIFGPNGSFAGVIVVSIDPLYLETFFDSIDVNKKGMVLLAGLDGIVRARASAYDRTIGQSILSGAIFKHLKYADSGSFVTTGERDGVVRLASYRKVRNYPLVVAVGLARSMVFATVTYHRMLYYGTAALVSALVLILTMMIVKRQIVLHRAAERLWEAANFDHLTKLPNRNRLNEVVSEIVTITNNNRGQFALLLLDLDNFKVVNDTLGHEAGDWVLCTIAERLRHNAPASSLVARLGGDEFAVLVRNSSLRDLDLLAQRVLSDLRQKIDYRGQSIEMCVSIGIAHFPMDGQTWGHIFRAADLALYQGKKRGGNRSISFDLQMLAEAEDKFEVLGSVRSAIEQQRIVPYYQPQVYIESGEIVGFEALARIVESNGRLRMPSQFISALDDSGVARIFGQSMLEAICRDLECCAENGIDIKRISINASTLELRGDDYADRVISVLQSNNISPGKIEIEISETVALNGNISVIENNLNKLRDRGIIMSLDDFGTGYASLTHIKSLPIRYVKIDRSFIIDIARDPESRAIVEAIVQLSHNLGKSVIAEGVDAEDQLQVLRDLRCDVVQGYLISEPLPFSEIPTFMMQNLVRTQVRARTSHSETRSLAGIRGV